MCLDTFSIVRGSGADQASEDGTNRPSSEGDMKATLWALVKNVDVKKAWYMEVVGAKRRPHS